MTKAGRIRSPIAAVLLLWQVVAVAHALTSSSPCSAATSPLFRQCPPPISHNHNDHHPHNNDNDSISKPDSFTNNSNKSSTDYSLNHHHHHDYTNINVPALQSLGYTTGFCQALERGTQIYAARYWIIDDSLSMSTKDGHFLLYTASQSGGSGISSTTPTAAVVERIERAPCSRWNELQETCLHHAILAVHCHIHTDFRMLNNNAAAGHFRIPRTFGSRQRRSKNNNSNNTSSFSFADVQHAQKVLSRAKPTGVTPLTARLRAVHKELEQSVLPKRVVSSTSGGGGQNDKVAIILATDGLPTIAANKDQKQQQGLSTDEAKDDFRRALQALPPQQVSVVIRLCTDDEAVVDYYNELEATMPHVQVLDDYWAEAVQVEKLNPWLNYGLQLHRVREMGCCGHVPLLKVLSQRTLTTNEVREFCQFLFGLSVSSASSSWEDLRQAVQVANEREGHVWNPVRSQLEPWINLDKIY